MTGLKARLAAGESVVGSWLTIDSAVVAEVLARAGFDFLVVDMEHTPLDLGACARLIAAIDAAGVAPLVRLSSTDCPVQIKRVMDAGAHGVIVPMVCRRAQLDQADAALHYPPRGRRGVGLGRAQAFGSPGGFEGYRQWLDKNAVLVAQIEHRDALEALDEIFDHPALDAYLIGPYDLSGSFGHPGQMDHPDLLTAVARVEQVAKRHGVPAGIHLVEPDPAALARHLDDGYRFVAYSVDFRMLDVQARLGLRARRS